ncbi:protein kinase domain-containing protein [Chondromyces crocatus]|uniref:Protein kinase domain-containing protein n=1 Tax=Chondromyces crocatus TaxID=52 RepID=A0A0K1ET24_CHOCO|nr:protein kinase [Chondromyces crocatus]AKT44055.1 uncharacterized protein CMC5_082930 [Chondromyces crocatus]
MSDAPRAASVALFESASSPEGDATQPAPQADAASLPDTLERPPTLEAPPPPALPATAPSPGTKLKHYELIRKLGEGGMGVVHLARDTKLGRLVAIKMLLQHTRHSAHRFLVEARATARCKHENIVVIHEVDEHEAHPYMVLEHLEGVTLRTWMEQRGTSTRSATRDADETLPARLSATIAIDLIIPVVRALGCAHEQGIVHRDLKPENIILSDAGPVKVLDFGIATRLATDTTPASARALLDDDQGPVGTWLYMAPEQWLNHDVDHRADFWAVGMMLHELLAGAHPLWPLRPDRLAQVVDASIPMPSIREVRPDLGPLCAVIERCLEKDRTARYTSARELLADLETLRLAPSPQRSTHVSSPFTGLAAFQEADAAWFFGRDTELGACLARLRRQPLVTIAGPSGAGKSSFVRAGIIPALKRSGETWDALVLRPGARPLTALAETSWQLLEAPGGTERDPTQTAAQLEEHAAILQREPGYLGAMLRAHCRKHRSRVLLFIDQFEELYTLGADATTRRAFLACTAGVADEASSPLRVVLAMRSDFLDCVTEDRQFLDEMSRGLAFLPLIDHRGLREALTRPLAALGARFESEALVESMLDALGGTRSPLPLLQFTAAKLWDTCDPEQRVITQASYDQIGGVAGALSAHADAVLDGLPAQERRLVRGVLLRLVTPERTRAVVRLDELRDLATDAEKEHAPDTIDRIVQHLADARLLSIEGSADAHSATVELVHESLVERWPRLDRWLDESAQDARFLARLRITAQQWEASGEAEGLLWREQSALEARTFSTRKRAEGDHRPLGIGSLEQRYLEAVEQLDARAQRRRLGVMLGAVTTIALVAAVVSWLAVRASNEASRATQEAARAQVTARRARNAARIAGATRFLSQEDHTQALALLREVEPPEIPHDWSRLAQLALQRGVSRVLVSTRSYVSEVAWSPDGHRVAAGLSDGTLGLWSTDATGTPTILAKQAGPIHALAWSPDGQRLATASADATVRVWSAAAGVDGRGPMVLRGHTDWVTAVAWSPDGTRLVSASRDGVRMWHADDTSLPVVFFPDVPATSVAWSPSGDQIACGFPDRSVRVWRADGSGTALLLQGHDGGVTRVAWSPDGLRLLGGSMDGTLRIWSSADGSAQRILRAHEPSTSPMMHAHGILSAAWSPDGRRVAAGAIDGTVRIWPEDGRGEPQIFWMGSEPVVSLQFSPDGQQLLAAAYKSFQIWTLSAHKQPVTLRGHPRGRLPVAWSARTNRIVIGSSDGIARIWNADGSGEPLVLRGHEGAIQGVAFSPDGQRVATGSDDRTLRLWNADGSGEPLVLRGHERAVYTVAFSPDGQRVATGSDDRTLRLWNADGSGEPLVLRGHEGVIQGVAFGPDGQRVATGSDDHTVRLWNADGAGEPRVLRAHREGVYAVAFSPDGRRLLTGAADHTARIWNADGTGAPLVLSGQWVSSAAWSPDGQHIVTGSGAMTVRVRRADGTGEPFFLQLDNPVTGVAFSPDGQRIVTATTDGLARIWEDLIPLRGLDDPILWTATDYCMPATQRMEDLDVPEDVAHADEQACIQRVAATRGNARNADQ